MLVSYLPGVYYGHEKADSLWCGFGFAFGHKWNLADSEEERHLAFADEISRMTAKLQMPLRSRRMRLGSWMTTTREK